MKKKLRPAKYLKAGELISSRTYHYCCYAIQDTDPYGFSGELFERTFFTDLFGVLNGSSFDAKVRCLIGVDAYYKWYDADVTAYEESMLQLRLMALALAHTLAEEYNAGRDPLASVN